MLLAVSHAVHPPRQRLSSRALETCDAGQSASIYAKSPRHVSRLAILEMLLL
jgi:hypothetical protein